MNLCQPLQELAARVSRISGVLHLKVLKDATSAAVKGNDVVDSARESRIFPTRDNIKNAAKKALGRTTSEVHGRPPSGGTPELKNRPFCDHHKEVLWAPSYCSQEWHSNRGRQARIFNLAGRAAWIQGGFAVLIPVPYGWRSKMWSIRRREMRVPWIRTNKQDFPCTARRGTGITPRTKDDHSDFRRPTQARVVLITRRIGERFSGRPGKRGIWSMAAECSEKVPLQQPSPFRWRHFRCQGKRESWRGPFKNLTP